MIDDSAGVWRMSGLTRDGTAEPTSQGQTLRRERGQGRSIFPVELTTSRIGNLTQLIHTVLKVLTTHRSIVKYDTIHAE